jgi:hypothetical protein
MSQRRQRWNSSRHSERAFVITGAQRA